MKVFKYTPNEELLNKYPDLRDDYNAFVRQLINKSSPVEKCRLKLASKYLFGRGLEIGAFHKPTPLPEHSSADYIDQLSVVDIKKRFPNMKDFHCVAPLLLDDGELGTCMK